MASKRSHSETESTSCGLEPPSKMAKIPETVLNQLFEEDSISPLVPQYLLDFVQVKNNLMMSPCSRRKIRSRNVEANILKEAAEVELADVLQEKFSGQSSEPSPSLFDGFLEKVMRDNVRFRLLHRVIGNRITEANRDGSTNAVKKIFVMLQDKVFHMELEELEQLEEFLKDIV